MWTPTSNHKFKLGNRPSKTDHRDHEALKLLSIEKTSTPPKSATVRPNVLVLDQGQLGACTTNATAQALHVEEVKDLVAGGKTLEAALTSPFMSRLFAYYLARAYDGTTGQDAGTEIRNVFRAISEYGYCDESFWAYSDATGAKAPFSLMPDSNAFREAFDQDGLAKKSGAPLVAYARISSTGAQRINDIKLAIAAGHGVVFGTEVTEALCEGDWNNGNPIVAPTSSAPIAGGHALMVGEYDGDVFGIVNSWGTGFGKDGWMFFDKSYLSWSQTTDLWVVQKAPIFSSNGAAK